MKWHSLLLIVFLVAAVFTAACTDEEVPVQPPVPEWGPVQPGQVLNVYGDVKGDGIPRGTIDTITFTIGLVPGMKPVPMENVTIVYADAIRTESLTPVPGLRGDPPQGSWGVLQVLDEVGAPNNRLEYEEKFIIRINPKAPLVPRQLITINVRPPTGTSLTIRRVSPPTIMKENNILLPM